MSLRALAPSIAQLLHLLVVQKRAQRIVEFGTSHGYSTLHLAAAAARTGGHVYSVDALPEKTAEAAANLEAAGLSDCVTLTTADGIAFATTLPQAIDFVLVDYPIPAFTPAYPALRARLARAAILFVDGGPDGYWQTPPGRAFLDPLHADPDLIAMVLPMQKEHLLVVAS